MSDNLDFDFGANADFEIDMAGMDNFDLDLSDDIEFETVYIKPRLRPEIKKENLKYKNAQDLAIKIGSESSMRAFCVVDGTFIFGDFIEAWINENGLFVKEMTISTLSMSPENIASLEWLMHHKLVKKLNLIVSAYFFSHERNNLIKLLYEAMEPFDDRFQLAVASTHCKTVCLLLHDDRKFIIHGSANLRSSSNLEQFVIEDDCELYDFNVNYNKRIVDLYKTIDHGVRRTKLWQAVQ